MSIALLPASSGASRMRILVPAAALSYKQQIIHVGELAAL
jgi:hypothetical protein